MSQGTQPPPPSGRDLAQYGVSKIIPTNGLLWLVNNPLGHSFSVCYVYFLLTATARNPLRYLSPVAAD